MADIKEPIHVDMNTLKSMSGSKITLELESQKKESGTITPLSDSGIGNSELDIEAKTPTPKILGNSSSSTPRHTAESVSGIGSDDNYKHDEELDDKTFIQTISVNLNVPDKSATPDVSSQRYNDRCISMQKLASHQENTTTSSENKSKKDIHRNVKLSTNKDTGSKVKSKENHKNKSDKRELQWMDLRTESTDRKPKVKHIARLSSNASVNSESDWAMIEKELRKFKTKGYDPDMAIMELLSTFSNTQTSSRLDWRLLTQSTNHTVSTNNDFFSVYPWSMRKRERSSSRLGDYLQQCVQENAVEGHKETAVSKKPPKGKKHSGPSGVTYVQNPRGYVKKDKSKTPGEVAIDQARYKNSKRYKLGNEEFKMPKCKTSMSLPNIRRGSSLSSSSGQGQDNPLKLPEIPSNRTVIQGKVYSSINRLTTPPTGIKTASSVPSLHEGIGKESYPFQIKHCGIPLTESLSFSPMSKSYITRSNTDIYSEFYNSFPLIVTDRDSLPSSRESSTQPLQIQKLSREQQIKHHIILQTLYARRAREPPKPPPVTPNVRRGRTMMSAEEMDTFMTKYKQVLKTQTPTCSRRSSYMHGNMTDDSDDDVVDDTDKSSIHSLSTMHSNVEDEFSI